jgi:ABC-type glutathione transport system ATPase component
VHISSLRKLLGKDKELIETIPRRGYRLIRSPQPEDHTVEAPGDPAPMASELPSNNVPLCYTPLIGREHALEDVKAALDSAPLVTLVGSGGIGKTQLVLKAARVQTSRFAEVIYVFFRLSSTRSRR